MSQLPSWISTNIILCSCMVGLSSAGHYVIYFYLFFSEKIAMRKVKSPSFYLDFNLMAAHWGLTGPNV